MDLFRKLLLHVNDRVVMKNPPFLSALASGLPDRLSLCSSYLVFSWVKHKIMQANLI